MQHLYQLSLHVHRNVLHLKCQCNVEQALFLKKRIHCLRVHAENQALFVPVFSQFKDTKYVSKTPDQAESFMLAQCFQRFRVFCSVFSQRVQIPNTLGQRPEVLASSKVVWGGPYEASKYRRATTRSDCWIAAIVFVMNVIRQTRNFPGSLLKFFFQTFYPILDTLICFIPLVFNIQGQSGEMVTNQCLGFVEFITLR